MSRLKLRRGRRARFISLDLCPVGCVDPSCTSPKSSNPVSKALAWRSFVGGPVETPGWGPAGVAGPLHWRFDVDTSDDEMMSALQQLGIDTEAIMKQST